MLRLLQVATRERNRLLPLRGVALCPLHTQSHCLRLRTAEHRQCVHTPSSAQEPEWRLQPGKDEEEPAINGSRMTPTTP